MKAVLTVGGAASQCHVIDVLKELGCRVITVDADENCLGKEKADQFYAISTIDVDKITAISEEESVSAVVAVQSDLCMITASKVAENLGVFGLPIEKAKLFTNKYIMREFLKENGFRYPAFAKCNCQADMEQFASKNGFPLVIKPLDSQGSRGVHIIHSMSELNCFEESTQYNRDAEGVIVEEYLGDEEYTVEGVVVDGKHYTLGVSKKTHYEDVRCVSKELFYSWEKEYEELITEHNMMIETTGLRFGITHSEYIRNRKGYVLVEFAARGGGSMIASHIVPAISGWDIEEIYAKQMLGLPVYLPEQIKNCAVLKFIELKEKRIERISGVDVINAMKNVLYFALNYTEGERVRKVSNDTNRHGFYIAWGTTKEELQNVMREIEDALVVEYKDE